MNMKKMVYLALTSVMVFLMVSSSMTFLQPTTAAPTGPTSATVNGNLNTDDYTLYPYANNSLSFGFSQYGEMIDPTTMTGLSYNGVDCFANPNVPQFEWSEGWLIDLTYTYDSVYHNIWAYALYSDGFNTNSIGGTWQWAPSPTSTAVLGGRKYGGYSYSNFTNPTPIGYVTTAPITVLYNGPREYIALVNTTISESPGTPLVSVLLTYIFDKVNKDVLVEKDVKYLDTRKFAGTMEVEFGDRGEWDLGNTVRPQSYAHFFLDEDNSYDYGYQPFYATDFNEDAPYAYFDVAQIISESTPGYVGFEAFWPTPTSEVVESTQYLSRSEELTSLSTYTATFTGNGINTEFDLNPPDVNPTPTYYPTGQGAWSNAPMVFINGQLVPPSQYYWDTSEYYVSFLTPPPSGSTVWVVYKTSVSQTDMSATLGTPYVMGEWAFDLSWTNTTLSTNQFEGITVYGITDYHDGSDVSNSVNYQLDSEVTYQLSQIFVPNDLYNAVEKQTDRWVEWSDDPIGSTTFTTSINNLPVLVVPTINTAGSGYYSWQSYQWNQYDLYVEKVIDLTNGTVLNRYLGQYGFISNPDGTATFTGLDPTHYYEFLYSTDPYYQSSNEYSATLEPPTSVSNDSVAGSTYHYVTPYIDQYWDDPTGIVHEVTANFNDENWGISFTNMSTTAFTENYTWTATTPWQEYNAQPFVLYKEDEIDLSTSTMNIFNETVGGGESSEPPMQIAMNQIYLDWSIYNDYTEFQNFYDTHFYIFNPDFRVSITVSYNTVTTHYTVSATLQAESDIFDETYEGAPIYAYSLPGRYEEGVVGTNAASVDSAGLGMVTAAFKDKEVEYGLSAGDIFAGSSSSQIPNQMPYVMSPTSAGTSWSNYYYSDGSLRTGFMDDWGTAALDNWGAAWPISSANIISVGGPLANLAAYYANDFSTAFYGLNQFTSYQTWQNAIVPLTCYSAPEKGYTDNATVGYGVISTTMDLNGTLQLLIWGNWGRDTFYLSQWFQQEGIFELQDSPCGLTSIIVQITYTSTPQGYQPTGYKVVECLGTISECLWTGNNVYTDLQFMKGGWHPDP